MKASGKTKANLIMKTFHGSFFFFFLILFFSFLLEKVCAGMGSAISNVHKDIYKSVRHCMTDRVMAVRSAAAKCLLEMLNHSPFLYTTELENLATLCFRAFDGSNYEVRCSVAKLLGSLIASTQQLPKNSSKPSC